MFSPLSQLQASPLYCSHGAVFSKHPVRLNHGHFRALEGVRTRVGRHGQDTGHGPQELWGEPGQHRSQHFPRGESLGFLAARRIKSSEACRGFVKLPAAERRGLPAAARPHLSKGSGCWPEQPSQLPQRSTPSLPRSVYQGCMTTGTDFVLLCLKFPFPSSLPPSFTHFLQFPLTTALPRSFPGANRGAPCVPSSPLWVSAACSCAAGGCGPLC